MSSDLKKIKSLVRKGTRNLNSFFYVGVVIGILMGPAVLLASLVPSVVEMLEAAGNDMNLMRVFGGVMTVLFSIALVEQFNKAQKDGFLSVLLEDQSSEIMWVYKEIGKGQVRRRHSSVGRTVATFIHVHFRLEDGRDVKVWLNEPDANRLIDLMRGSFPKTSFGYSEEIEKAYKQDKVTLRIRPMYSDGVKRTVARIAY